MRIAELFVGDSRDSHVMSARKKEPGEPFNNPFAADLKKLKRRVGRAARSAPGAAPKASTHKEPTAEASEDEMFRNAMDGAVPLGESSERVAARPAHDERTAMPYWRDTHNSKVDLLADEHFDVRFSDQFIRARGQDVSRETLAKLERGEFAVRSHVDLHGIAFDDAKNAVDEFLSSAHRRGERCVLVITGKGRNSPGQVGVLRQGIPEWLARGPSARRVLAFVTARPCDGGEGALYVLLREQPSRKQRIEVESGGGT